MNVLKIPSLEKAGQACSIGRFQERTFPFFCHFMTLGMLCCKPVLTQVALFQCVVYARDASCFCDSPILQSRVPGSACRPRNSRMQAECALDVLDVSGAINAINAIDTIDAGQKLTRIQPARGRP